MGPYLKLISQLLIYSPSGSVRLCTVVLGSLRPTRFSPLTLTSYVVKGARPTTVVVKTPLPTERIMNWDAESEALRYSTT